MPLKKQIDTTKDPLTQPPTRLPRLRESHRQSIHDYLSYVLRKVEIARNDLRAAMMTAPTDPARDQLRYYQHQISTLRWLIGMNQQRRSAAAHRRAEQNG